MMRPRLAISLLTGAMIALAVAGCGSSDNQTTWHAGQPGGGQGGGDVMNEAPLGDSDPSAHIDPHSAATVPASRPSTGPSGKPSASTPGSNVAGQAMQFTGTSSVALTFDDGPGEETQAILDLLRQNNVKATFCLIGVNVKAHPDLVRAIVADGHTLCNHTWKHDLKLGTHSPDQIRQDLQMTNDAIHEAAPDAPIKYFRHPGGNFTPAAIKVAKDMGMTSIGWDVDPTDWNIAKYQPGPTMTNHILSVIRTTTKPGSIILSHDSGGNRTSTLAAYQTLVPELASKFHLDAMPN